MYTANGGGGAMGGSGIAYNYPFPLDGFAGVPPTFLFRSGQHEVVDSSMSSPAAVQYNTPMAPGQAPVPVSLNYSAVASANINQSMESLTEESLISAQSSPEYSVDYQTNRSYYPQISTDNEPQLPLMPNWLSNAEGADFEMIGQMAKKAEMNGLAVGNGSCKAKHKKTKLLPKHEIMGNVSLSSPLLSVTHFRFARFGLGQVRSKRLGVHLVVVPTDSSIDSLGLH